MALGSQRRGAQVLDEWRKNSLFTHRSVYPQYYEGQWSGPDVYSSINGPVPGESPVGYRLHNAWSHTTPIITLPDLVGLDLTDSSMTLRPFLELDSFNISSYRFSLAKATEGTTVRYSCTLRFANAVAETLAVLFEAPASSPQVRAVARQGSLAACAWKPKDVGVGVCVGVLTAGDAGSSPGGWNPDVRLCCPAGRGWRRSSVRPEPAAE